MLLLLPEELIIEVLSHLTLQDIKNILQVCKTLKRLGEDDAIWIGFYENRYFSRYVSPVTYELCEEKTWRFLYHNKAKLENRLWEAGDSPKKNNILVQNRALEVTCMKYDSKYVVTGGGFADVWDFDPQTLLAPKTVQVYDLKTGRKVRTLPGHADSITCVQFHGTTVVSGAKDHMIKIWRPLGHKWSKKIPFEEKTLFGHTKSVCCLDWRETDALLVSGGKDKKINLWDITSEMNVDCIYAPAIPYCIQLYNNHIVAGGKDRKIRIWDCDTSQQISVMKGHKGWVSCLQMSNHLIVSGGGDGTIRIFDTRSGQNTRTIKTETSIFSVGWITCLQWDENKIVTGSADKSIRIHDIISGKCINTLKGHRDIVTGVQYDSQKLLSSSLDRTVRTWDFSASSANANPTENESARCIVM